jgi:hypothetical protein
MHPSSGSQIRAPFESTIPSANLDLLHLSLLHHYSTSTCATIFCDSPIQAIWRNEVPRLAFSYAPVLHAIFAVSALHISFLNPAESSRYRLIAADHYQKASAALRQALSLSCKIGPELAAAPFATSCLLALYVFADPSLRSPDVPSALLWMPMIRGTKILFDEYRESLQKSSFAPALRIKNPSDPVPNFDLPTQLPDDIDHLYLTEPDSKEAAIHAEAVQKLKETWHWAQNRDFRMGNIFIWPNIVSEDFISLLRQKNPRAIALVGFYYCTMFSDLEELWWNRGTLKEELKIIQGMVGTTEKWARLLGEADFPWRRGTIQQC